MIQGLYDIDGSLEDPTGHGFDSRAGTQPATVALTLSINPGSNGRVASARAPGIKSVSNQNIWSG